MNKSFNLLDEPWLPVRLQNGVVCDLGLLELFERAGEISALAETAPPSLIAQYRLLLAIVHRALSSAQGRWTDAERARWHRGGLPPGVVRDYLEQWRERFWLFHPEQPFMQVAALAEAEEARDKYKPWTQISLASANGNAPVVFDHSCDLTPRSISPADALRTLLGFLQFTPGGLVKTLRDSDKAGALANTAAVMPLGASLAQSLCLALHPPTQSGHQDLPCWELAPPTVAQLRAEPRLAAGPNDRYSRQTRAVLLLPDAHGRVQWLRFAAGIALGEDVQAPDPMASYRAGSNGLVRLSFTEGRAFWRDLPALLPDAEGLACQPAAVLGWAANLQFLLGDSQQPLLVAGLASDQAKLLRWRSERIGLPAALLTSPECANELRAYVRRAEELFGAVRKLAAQMLAETLPDPGSKDSYARARNLFDSGPAAALYFASAERTLGQVMVLLGSGDLDDLEQAETQWRQALLAAAQAAWQAVREGLGRSPGALRAEAKLYPRLLALLSPLRSPENTLSTADKEARA
ncbi:type I-E CRISPR-associated protein Cse1/CasA [Pseudomonas benzenivorans]|uniref:Type I-E CRISPR-associated protein Cse1/CasA n=1 Tax=Pseudomonas benzenivorans TaxID=556533 RepID=A0ABZ0PTL2_9PSED|nr:type I-E CRISPR-associated protein Cse1/CasA [Pseudomonas benzenivorans]WPC04512.1 type I-E CRISPR-associated protein Cse1/CasA [Pseudomonas benzenivorans]